MQTRLVIPALRSACLAAVVFGVSTPASAFFWPFCWHSYPVYRPAYYGPVYSPGYGAGCSPCSAGGCGVQSWYGPACGCSPCRCAPCGASCGGNCDVAYAPDPEPVPDAPPDTGRRTFADEPTADSTTTDDPDNPPLDDDFGPVEREEASEGQDPFPEFERPVLPMDPADDEDGDPQPLNLDDEGITLRVTPTRSRVRVTARYRSPRIVRLDVEPDVPWQTDLPATQVASN